MRDPIAENYRLIAEELETEAPRPRYLAYKQREVFVLRDKYPLLVFLLEYELG